MRAKGRGFRTPANALLRRSQAVQNRGPSRGRLNFNSVHSFGAVRIRRVPFSTETAASLPMNSLETQMGKLLVVTAYGN